MIRRVFLIGSRAFALVVCLLGLLLLPIWQHVGAAEPEKLNYQDKLQYQDKLRHNDKLKPEHINELKASKRRQKRDQLKYSDKLKFKDDLKRQSRRHKAR